MRNLLLSFVLSLVAYESSGLLSQSLTSNKMDSTKSYFSIAIIPTWSKINVSNRSGELDEVRGSITSGLVVDIAYLRFSKKLIYHFSLGHGYYNEGFYYSYENVSNPAFPYTSTQAFEKNQPMQYSSFKFCVANNFKHNKRNVKYYGGIDFRYNWGYNIFTTGERRNVSYGSSQVINPGLEDESTTSLFYANSRIVRNISINPIIGLDYMLKLKNKTFLSFGAFFSIPFIPVIQSKVEFYPDFEDLNSTFNTSFNGGLFGVKIEYIIPN